jgi:hypothetical protein
MPASRSASIERGVSGRTGSCSAIAPTSSSSARRTRPSGPRSRHDAGRAHRRRDRGALRRVVELADTHVGVRRRVHGCPAPRPRRRPVGHGQVAAARVRRLDDRGRERVDRDLVEGAGEPQDTRRHRTRERMDLRRPAAGPLVIVPVLSSSTTCRGERLERAAALDDDAPTGRGRHPADDRRGAARISGHGVATTSTASARTGSPDTSHAPAASTRVTTGTRRRSGRRPARTAPARWTPARRGARCRRRWTRRGRGRAQIHRPAAFTTPLGTICPAVASTGRDSPVSADSSSTPRPTAACRRRARPRRP